VVRSAERSWSRRRRAVQLAVLSGLVLLASGAGASPARAGDSFVVVCNFDHAVIADPIKYPGMPGVGHLHDFFGAAGVGASTTNADLRSPSTATLCGQAADKAAYWVPSLYVDGVKQRPDHLKAYYNRDGRPVASMQPFVDDLRIIAGNSAATNRDERQGLSYWRCKNVITNVFSDAIQPPLDCGPNEVLVMSVRFPSCALDPLTHTPEEQADSPNHMSHMAYANDPVGQAPPLCPVGYPINVPRLEIHVHFRTGGSPNVTLAPPLPSIYAAHADFMNGWLPGALQAEMDRCYSQDDCRVYTFPGFWAHTPIDENADGFEDGTGIQLDQAPVAPSFTQAASISGNPRVGQVLTAHATATGYPPPELYYQWQRCVPGCQDIVQNAEGQSYTAGALDLNKDVRVAVRAVNSVGTVYSYSQKVHISTL
jgi:Domain of unknown function (DUF1996)